MSDDRHKLGYATPPPAPRRPSLLWQLLEIDLAGLTTLTMMLLTVAVVLIMWISAPR